MTLLLCYFTLLEKLRRSSDLPGIVGKNK